MNTISYELQQEILAFMPSNIELIKLLYTGGKVSHLGDLLHDEYMKMTDNENTEFVGNKTEIIKQKFTVTQRYARILETILEILPEESFSCP